MVRKYLGVFVIPTEASLKAILYELRSKGIPAFAGMTSSPALGVAY